MQDWDSLQEQRRLQRPCPVPGRGKYGEERVPPACLYLFGVFRGRGRECGEGKEIQQVCRGQRRDPFSAAPAFAAVHGRGGEFLTGEPFGRM